MGTSFLHKQSQSQVKKKLNMKTLLVIALFAVAHAEEEAAADPVAPVVYTHPFYHHMAAPVYAHHPAVYHHAPVYTHHVAPLSMLPLMCARTKVDNLQTVPMELLPDLLSMLWPMPPLWSPPLLLHLLPKLPKMLSVYRNATLKLMPRL